MEETTQHPDRAEHRPSVPVRIKHGFVRNRMHEKLLAVMRQHTALSEEDAALCTAYFEQATFPKNRIVEAEGKIPQFLYFVASGYMRLFHYNDKGDAVTTHINCPPGFITSYSHFIAQTLADENVECITECELLRISKHNLDLITSQSRALKDFSIWVFQQSVIYHENRARALTTLSAAQRYQKLIEDDPHMIRQVPLQYIASFLGMNAKSLSRIRKSRA